ncbi:MAG: DNA polymerase IV [Fusobacteriaceae bacterium]|jgi:DNA polymerase-4|nr:DNA polymerase IV [Fusobacteriaceae bacterium]
MEHQVIMHYDMDAFFAAVEIRDNPALAGKPMIVGESIVTTASYEARKYGIHSAMSVYEAKKLCPRLIIVPASKGKYGQVAAGIQELILKMTDRVEFASIDEGYVDITGIVDLFPSWDYFAGKFRQRIFDHTQLSCSVGIGFNRLSAKMASEINKPGGHFIFPNPEQFVDYIKDKKVGIIPGVGKKFEAELEALNFRKIEDLYRLPVQEMSRLFGNARGAWLWNVIRGIDFSRIDDRPLSQSIGNENTFYTPLTTEPEYDREWEEIFRHAYGRLRAHEYICKNVTIKVKFSDFETITRSKTFGIPTDDAVKLRRAMLDLFENEEISRPIRLLGVYFGGLIEKENRQLNLEFLPDK